MQLSAFRCLADKWIEVKDYVPLEETVACATFAKKVKLKNHTAHYYFFFLNKGGKGKGVLVSYVVWLLVLRARSWLPTQEEGIGNTTSKTKLLLCCWLPKAGLGWFLYSF